VHRFWVIPCVAVVLIASGCLGSSTAHAPTPVTHKRADGSPPIPTFRHALFDISGAYATTRGAVRRTHFTLGCDSQTTYEQLTRRSWQARLCVAILNFQTAPRRNVVCGCPLEIVEVSVRGEIQGRRIHERFSYCMCGDGKRAARDVRVVLKTHPPFQTRNGGG
jgi:hypothetical protein